jgi:L-ascorbate oxidase
MGNSTEVLGRVPQPQVEGYLTYGGSVVGNKTYDPVVVDYFPLSVWSEESKVGNKNNVGN